MFHEVLGKFSLLEEYLGLDLPLVGFSIAWPTTLQSLGD